MGFDISQRRLVNIGQISCNGVATLVFMAEIPACSKTTGEENMSWTTPQFVDMRFGFEITMYIANR